MLRRATVAVGVLAVGATLWPAVGAAKLPHPKRTLIVPGKSIAGIKLGMTQAEVFHLWGRTGCMAGFCTWTGPGSAGHAERAVVSFAGGSVIEVAINAATTNGTSEKFKPGTLSKWKTAKNIHLGSQKAAVKRAYPRAKANNSTGVNGFDLFTTGAGGLNVTHFSSFGVGPSATRLRYIQLACFNGKC
jgi:hypothetical protein